MFRPDKLQRRDAIKEAKVFDEMFVGRGKGLGKESLHQVAFEKFKKEVTFKLRIELGTDVVHQEVDEEMHLL